jgi:hypothetical protein
VEAGAEVEEADVAAIEAVGIESAAKYTVSV